MRSPGAARSMAACKAAMVSTLTVAAPRTPALKRPRNPARDTVVFIYMRYGADASAGRRRAEIHSNARVRGALTAGRPALAFAAMSLPLRSLFAACAFL